MQWLTPTLQHSKGHLAIWTLPHTIMTWSPFNLVPRQPHFQPSVTISLGGKRKWRFVSKNQSTTVAIKRPKAKARPGSPSWRKKRNDCGDSKTVKGCWLRRHRRWRWRRRETERTDRHLLDGKHFTMCGNLFPYLSVSVSSSRWNLSHSFY